ncbi:MAG: hypothetical protein RLZZ234_825 [Candidatus Parcubacteria bacterium]
MRFEQAGNQHVKPLDQPAVAPGLTNIEKERTVATVESFYRTFKNAHLVEFDHISDMYKKIPHEELIVRREDPKRVRALFDEDASYTINFEDTRYANCVVWTPETDVARNISNAYLEGYGNENAVVTVVGIRKTEGMDIQKLAESIPNFYGLNRSGVRSLKGTVNPGDVAFISLRIPAHLFPETRMTEEEKDSLFDWHERKKSGERTEPVMIHRGFLNPRVITH